MLFFFDFCDVDILDIKWKRYIYVNVVWSFCFVELMVIVFNLLDRLFSKKNEIFWGILILMKYNVGLYEI